MSHLPLDLQRGLKRSRGKEDGEWNTVVHPVWVDLPVPTKIVFVPGELLKTLLRNFPLRDRDYSKVIKDPLDVDEKKTVEEILRVGSRNCSPFRSVPADGVHHVSRQILGTCVSVTVKPSQGHPNDLLFSGP